MSVGRIVPLRESCERTPEKNRVDVRLRASVNDVIRIWECINTEFDQEAQQELKKVSLGRTVRLRKGNYWKFDCSLYKYIFHVRH